MRGPGEVGPGEEALEVLFLVVVEVVRIHGGPAVWNTGGSVRVQAGAAAFSEKEKQSARRTGFNRVIPADIGVAAYVFRIGKSAGAMGRMFEVEREWNGLPRCLARLHACKA